MPLMAHTRTWAQMTRNPLAQILPPESDGQKPPNSQSKAPPTAIR